MSMADDSSPKVDVSQIDLLSGSLAILVILGTTLQVMPTPESLCLPRLRHFLEWLHEATERNFDLKIYTCTETCQTCVYEPTLECIEKRLKTNLRISNITGCKGKKLMAAKELARILQQENNAVSFLELAKLTHYSRIQSLQSVVRVMHCLSRIHSTIVSLQWIGVVLYFAFGWLFSWGLPKWFMSFWDVILVVILRRRPRCMNHDLYSPIGYQMAELAKHRLIEQHVPWIRYAILDILYQQLNRSLSLHIPDTSHIYFYEPTLRLHRSIISKLSTDECSSARMLFTLSLHSLKMILLCKHVSFIPPYMLTSSIGYVQILSYGGTATVSTSHPAMDQLFCELFALSKGKNGHPRFSDGAVACLGSLLDKFSSPLGKVVIEEYKLNTLLNIATKIVPPRPADTSDGEVVPPLSGETVNDEDVGSSSRQQQQQQQQQQQLNTGLKVDRVEIPSELAQMLYKENMRMVGALDHCLNSEICVANLMWSPSPWLFDTCMKVCNGICRKPCDHGLVSTPNVLLYSLAPIHPPTKDVPCFDAYVKSWKDGLPFDYYLFLCQLSHNSRNNFLAELPPWCVCQRNHCRGLCTVIVDSLQMGIKEETYLELPYIFRTSRPWYQDDRTGLTCPLAVMISENVEQLQDVGLQPVSSLEYTEESALNLSNSIYSKTSHLAVVYGGDMLIRERELADEDMQKLVCLKEEKEMRVPPMSDILDIKQQYPSIRGDYRDILIKTQRRQVHKTDRKGDNKPRFFGPIRQIGRHKNV